MPEYLAEQGKKQSNDDNRAMRDFPEYTSVQEE